MNVMNKTYCVWASVITYRMYGLTIIFRGGVADSPPSPFLHQTHFIYVSPPFCFYSTAQILRQVNAIPTLNHCKLKDILNMIKESISKHINIFSVLYSETFLNTPPKEIYPRIVISLDEY